MQNTPPATAERSRRWLAMLMAMAVLVTSCAKPATPPAPTSPPDVSPVAVTADNSPTVEMPILATAPSAGMPVVPSQEGDSGEKVKSEAHDSAENAPSVQQSAEVERLILFTPRGPLVVHLAILIDGKPQRPAIEQLLNDATRAARTEGRNDVTWAELAVNTNFASGQFGNAPISTPAMQQQIARQFDTNHDGRVQPKELAACLSQDNAGGRGFAARSVNDYRTANKQDSLLFDLLDRDHDGQLSAAEISDASVRLRSRDADNDDVVSIADFRRPVSADQTMRDRREYGPEVIIELTKLKIDSIYYALCDLYDAGTGLDAASFAITPRLLAQLDANRNGKVDQEEVAGLLAARPDLLLTINFGSDPPGQAEPTVALKATSADLTDAGTSSNTVLGRLHIALPGCELAVSAFDQATSASGKQRTYNSLQVQARVGQVEDVLFNWLDANRDGRLTAREMLGAAKRLTQLDGDGDGAVAAGELPDQLAFVILRGASWRDATPFGPSQFRRKPGAQAPSWLTAMDQNTDGEVSLREFLGTPAQFEKLDLNADGFLDTDEARQAEAPSE